MARLFGTDGIRGFAGRHPITPEMGVKVGRALGRELRDRLGPEVDRSARVLVAQDTRISGDMLTHAIAAGLCGVGSEACLGGVLPTPGLALVTKWRDFDAGVMISASHNPFHDNGIKIFRADGFKLSDEMEDELERRIHEDEDPLSEEPAMGRVSWLEGVEAAYGDFLVDGAGDTGPLAGLRVALDCANGATYRVAPAVFERLGAQVRAIGVEPDGRNINAGCGSEHRERLTGVVLEGKYDVGFAFDGDGDRVIAVDEMGETVTGDRMLALCAREMKRNGELSENLVVSTVMSNVGLGIALRDLQIEHVTTKVGDRYVLEQMLARKGCLGGEDSGHMIFLKEHTTGDGILAALKIARIMQASRTPLSELAEVMAVYPQRLINVPVHEKRPIEEVAGIVSKVEAVERFLGDRGRVLIRYSGTQPMCRVMVEGPTEEAVERACRELADVVKSELGTGEA